MNLQDQDSETSPVWQTSQFKDVCYTLKTDARIEKAKSSGFLKLLEKEHFEKEFDLTLPFAFQEDAIWKHNINFPLFENESASSIFIH